MVFDNDLLSIQQARILAENAFMAQKKLAAFSQEKLDCIVEAVAEAAFKHSVEFAELSHSETDYGNVSDKIFKNRFAVTTVLENIRPMRCVGVINEDAKKRTLDIGVPMGVIVALCPVTSPVSTTIQKTLLAIKSGNAIIFSPHPSAQQSIKTTLKILMEAAEAAGLPRDCLGYLDTVSKSGAFELFNHPATSLIMLSSVQAMLKPALASGKPVIYGGTGNGPAFIERSADVKQAVQDIIASKTFDYGIAPSAEQSVVVDSCIELEVRKAFEQYGGYFMSADESLRLAALLFCPDGKHKKRAVGLSAAVLAHRADIKVPPATTILLAERKYVSDSDPYSRELLAPVLAYYVEDDWMHACEKCIELLLHEKKSHTLVIHSNNEDVIRLFALKKPVGRLLVNTPAAFGGIGATTNLFPSLVLGSGSAGLGITSENVSPLNLIYIRKVGYGVRPVSQDISFAKSICKNAPQAEIPLKNFDKLSALQLIFKRAAEVIDETSRK